MALPSTEIRHSESLRSVTNWQTGNGVYSETGEGRVDAPRQFPVQTIIGGDLLFVIPIGLHGPRTEKFWVSEMRSRQRHWQIRTSQEARM